MTSILENWEFFPNILQGKWYFELAQLKSKTSGLGLGLYLGEDYSRVNSELLFLLLPVWNPVGSTWRRPDTRTHTRPSPTSGSCSFIWRGPLRFIRWSGPRLNKYRFVPNLSSAHCTIPLYFIRRFQEIIDILYSSCPGPPPMNMVAPSPAMPNLLDGGGPLNPTPSGMPAQLQLNHEPIAPQNQTPNFTSGLYIE